MRVAISYPPIVNADGQKAMVSQNRNVQYFKKPTYLLPVTYAQAATWLKQIGHDVYWDDGNAQLKSYDQWLSDLVSWAPDIIVLESTTPVMKFYWRVVDQLKQLLPASIVIMTGYHSMRKPEETMGESKTDIVLRSNHVDFVLSRLVPYIESNKSWRLTCPYEGLVIRMGDNQLRSTGNFRQVEPLEKSPIIDRDLVDWKRYAFENGNYLQTPGTYATSVIRDCMFGKCTFCRYNGPDLTFSMMSIERSLDEYEDLIINHGVKEIFDDSGVWYRGVEARKFAQGIIDRGLHKKGCYFGINTRFEYLDEETIKLMAKANFRFVLLGYEAADDETLQRLNKGYQLQHVESCLTWMSKYGLHPHLTIMVGYYWQTQEQLDKTVSEVRRLMFSGLARTLQVTLCTPLDYTPYHQECIDHSKLLTNDYDDFDMSKLIVKTPIPHDRYYEAVRQMYSIAFHPKFIARQIAYLFTFRKRDWQFLFTYSVRAIRRVRQHVFNLTKNASQSVY
ncbi:radical SAM protein [Polynucleobacter wuianus]|uniref:B12-binding domain-containing radical SAM protein n=1 Tax=Polynucleobacter wuianus TaxID=1743168 RepID=UPI001C0DBBF9|nr:radical SAM protein [Polynucleobacter wuianus]MBU3610984.1 radical SAM protein [Polynucleobacter wuianus]